MASGESALFTREDLLGGLSSRHATTLLFAIEGRTAHALAESRQAVPIVLSDGAAARREHAFLEALAQGRQVRGQPTIRDLERYAAEWADLVPEDAALRAGVAHLLGGKYVFTHRSVPRLRAALGLDVAAVGSAHQRVYGAPIETIYAPRVQLSDQLRWAGSRLAGRLDALPTFWLAFTVTLIMGAVNLALPIAVAGVGALPGVALIVMLGIINMITIAAMVEVVTRSGSIRYGNAFIGTVVADYLGRTSSAILSAVLTAFSFGLLLIFYIGISTTLADATFLPASIWMILLFLVGLYFLSRGSLDATIASAIVITAINVVLLLVLTALAFSHFRPEHLTYVNLPWQSKGTFDPIVLGALIGVVLDIFAAHLLVAIFGKMLLRRDPTGRSVVRGHTAGIGFAMVLNVVWVLAVSGAIAPQVLARESSTVLLPLAAEIGPQVRVIGAIFVILSMGLGLIQFSLALFNLARERIAQRVTLGGPRGQFLLALAPVILVVLVAEWMLLTGTGSFTGILGIIGVLVHSLMSGIFPVLLLMASRRKGELVPGVTYGFLGNPVIIGGIYLLFIINLFFHALVIWQHPLLGIGGAGIGLLTVGVTISMVHRGAFAPRLVVELRDDRRRYGRSRVSVTAGGQPARATVHLRTADDEPTVADATGDLPDVTTLREIAIQLPAGRARELKIWAHTITPDGGSESLQARATVHDGDEARQLDLGQPEPSIVLRIRHESCRMDLSFPAASAAATPGSP